MAHHFVTTVHNGTVLCHHSIEWHITLSPLSIMAHFVSPFYRMAHHFVTTVHNGTVLCHHSIEWHSTVVLPLEWRCCVATIWSGAAQ